MQSKKKKFPRKGKKVKTLDVKETQGKKMMMDKVHNQQMAL